MTTTESAIEQSIDPLVSSLAGEVARIANCTPEERRAERERLSKSIRKGRPLPEGATLNDVLVGQWPGEETDEQIREALERLS